MYKNISLDENNYLRCPVCDFDYLHQKWAKVIFRDNEDKDGILVSAERKKIATERVLDKDIPGRRDVIYIDFWCEGCHKHSILEIMQHKGNTIIKWEKKGYKQNAAN